MCPFVHYYRAHSYGVHSYSVHSYSVHPDLSERGRGHRSRWRRPAGLRAAEVAAGLGVPVTVYDAKPSAGRKLLIAGKSGLNLTNAAEFADFLSAYSGETLPAALWRQCLSAFDAKALRAWAASLGVETFATSSGKVFPVGMKGGMLLTRWLARLRELGVTFCPLHRWCGWSPPHTLTFESPDGTIFRSHRAVVLALGGGSWPETGSDGQWTRLLQSWGVTIQPLVAANCGWELAWTPETEARVEGRPLQNIRVRAGGLEVLGELMLTRYGMEGTLIYQLGRVLRSLPQPSLEIDFKPTFTIEQLLRKMESAKRNFVAEARQRWRLPDAAAALLEQFHGPFASAEALARATKACRLPLLRPRPLAEAISTAGGVSWQELDDTLMLMKRPGIFCAGEMLDWDAPTGGFLLQGCFATGTRAGEAAARWCLSP